MSALLPNLPGNPYFTCMNAKEIGCSMFSNENNCEYGLMRAGIGAVMLCEWVNEKCV